MLDWIDNNRFSQRHIFRRGGKSEERSYQYVPLNPGSPQIRVLVLYPGRWKSEINCNLQHASLNDQPSYEALSYVWGKTIPPSHIRLGGCLHTITANLEAALRQMRHRWKPRRLWVDALCINQEDISERAEQVQKMHAIYSQASNVLAWTGIASHESEDAMTLIQDIGEWSFKNELFEYTETGSLIEEMPSTRLARTGFVTKSRNWTALWDFLERPYWKRVWVVQELAVRGFLSDYKPCTIFCGSMQVDLVYFLRACLYLLYNELSGNMGNDITGEVDPIYRPLLARDQKHPPAFSMVQILQRANHRYSLDWLATKIKNIRPDYGKSLAAVLMDYVKFFVRRDQNLYSLNMNRRELCTVAPSWTPEVNFAKQAMDSLLEPQNQINYRPAGNRKTDVEFDDDTMSMLVRGAVIGTVQRVIGPLHDVTNTLGSEAGIPDIGKIFVGQGAIQQLWAFAGNLRKESHYDAFWRTLVVNKQRNVESEDQSIYPAPKAWGHMSLVWFGLQDPPPNFQPDAPEHVRLGLYSLPFGRACIRIMTNRTFFTTSSGHMGNGPYLTKPGDLVVILYGSQYCFVLRPEEDRYRVIGYAYVHGAMDGEMVREGSQAEERVFTLR